MKGKASRNNKISFGDYALQSLEPSWITSRQIEATRRTITRCIKRGGKLWITIFPDKTVTARAAESRMGSGKGAVDYWVAVVKPGTIMFELSGVPVELARKAMTLASYKLPVKTKFITREDID
jgi:large subunit ribosomal protein L16